MAEGRSTVVVVLSAALLLSLGVIVGLVLAPVPVPAPAAPGPAPPGEADIRRIVAEEVRRRDLERPVKPEAPRGRSDDPAAPGSSREVVARAARPSPDGPVPADPALNADPVRRETVRTTLLDLRRVFIENDLGYNVGPGKRLERPDPARLQQFPDARVWPARILGFVEQNPDRYEVLGADGRGFDGTRANGAWVFTAPLDRPVATVKYASLVFEQGIAEGGIVTVQSYATILCRGDCAGKIDVSSYATVVVDGNFTGSLVIDSYATILLKGAFQGTVESDSYANLRLMGGWSGKGTFKGSANLYFAGHTPRSVLDAIDFKGRCTVTLEGSDLPVGATKLENGAEVLVLEPR